MVLLAVSFLAALGFLAAALIHDGSTVGTDGSRVVGRNGADPQVETESSSSTFHATLELALWGGAGLAAGMFAAVLGFLRREIRAEKQRHRSVVQRRKLLRQVEAYERVRRRLGPRPNN